MTSYFLSNLSSAKEALQLMFGYIWAENMEGLIRVSTSGLFQIIVATFPSIPEKQEME